MESQQDPTPPESTDPKSKSQSSIIFDATLTKPDPRNIIYAVSILLHSKIIEDRKKGRVVLKDSELYIFSEEKYVVQNPQAFEPSQVAKLQEVPQIEDIQHFLLALFDCADFSPESFIICSIYINRLITIADMPLLPTNWRPLLLCSLLVAQQIWDDRELTHSDFVSIYPFFTTSEITSLMNKFLDLIQFNVTIKPSLYAEYYYELRTLLKENEGDFPFQQLNQEETESLVAKSQRYYNLYKEALNAKNMGVNHKSMTM